MSTLAFVASTGKIHHLNALLSANYSEAHESWLTNLPDIINAFFRALENGKASVLLRLLQYPGMTDVITDVKLLSTIQKHYPKRVNNQDFYIPQLLAPTINNYLHQITKPDYYPLRYNKEVRPQGNIALIMAASLPSSDIFNYILQTFPLIKQQLANSALVAFLSATRTVDGTPKESINATIVNQLLAVPHVYNYALSREYDLRDLVSAFNDLKKEEAPISLGFCSKFFKKVSSSSAMEAVDSLDSIYSSSDALTDKDDRSSSAALSDIDRLPSRCTSISPYYIGGGV